VPASRLSRRGLAAAATVALMAGMAGSATAQDHRSDRAARSARDAATANGATGLRFAGAPLAPRKWFSSAQHDGTNLHLPPARENIELVGKLEMNTPEELRRDPVSGAADPTEPPVVPGQIADVAVYKDHAYLNSWDEPSCRRGGTFIADISNPAAPQQVGFLRALEGRYHGEGAHVVTLDTPAFQGDLLAVNNEAYTGTDPASGQPCTDDPLGNGGFDLYDVTNPRNPVTKVQGAGDTGEDGLVGAFPTANSSHSAFMWQGRDRRAFIVIVDNVEGTDVDIFEITDPSNPRPVAEFDLDQHFAGANGGQGIVDEGGLGGAADVFLHDMVVKQMGDRFIMLADYWDAGYVTLDVTNPADPTYIGDSTFDAPDPFTGLEPQEGNGHQAEFSHDNRFILAADEDFSPFRTGTFQITTGPGAGTYESVSVGGGASAGFLPDNVMNGPTVYGGYGCDASDPIPRRADVVGLRQLEPGEEAIVVLQRGPSGDPANPEPACFPGEKAANGIAAGYDAVLLVNHHVGEAGGVFCGSGDFPPEPPIVTVCTTHEALHVIFGEPNDTTVPYPPGHGPPLGAVGETVSADAIFDGWGYTRLIENTPGKMREIDAYAIEEAQDERYAFGFGDLSVHEFATDPATNLAYSSYYAGGVRVFSFGEDGITPRGKFIDEGGSNFWGIEQFTAANGERLMAASDRDYGLYVLRYTGPGAIGPRPPAQATAGPRAGRCANALVATTAGVRIVGSALGDLITGLAVRDVIDGRAGDDCINGLGGNDDLRGGRGIDTVDGGRGNDRIRGDSGRGNLRGGSGNDRVSAGSARDVLFGNTGKDRLAGGGGKDQLFGGAGRDRLTGGKGKDTIEAGGGNDRILAKDGRADRIDCGFGRDTVASRDRSDRLTSCERKARASRKRG
jgi:RTX calcium-binding nonapeptide repeat (4 copies)